MNDDGKRFKGKVLIAGGKELRFNDLYEVMIRAGDKAWVFWDATETVLRFRPQRSFWHAKQGVPDDLVFRAWRQQKGFSQAKAAQVLGKSLSLVQKVEQGLRRLSSKTLDQILQSLDHALYVRAGKRGMVKISARVPR